MTSIGTLFGGFGGVDIGARQAGLELAWGVEYDAAIAEVANANLGNHVRVANLLDCDPIGFEAVDILHASPPCPAFSVANAGKGETALDIALGRKVAAFVATLKPKVFTLENVWAYRLSRSWHIIQEELHEQGYWVSVDHANAADYGVPQTRRRMIVRAVLGGFVPYPPEPVAWVGWYAAVADLIDTLPESQFAPWQLARLPELLQTVLVPQGGDQNYDLSVHAKEEPSFTITANHNMLGVRAFLMQVQGEGGDGLLYADEPMQTVTANHGAAKYRAFLMAGGGNTNFEDAYPGKGCRYDEEPAMTITATSKEGGALPKAFLVDGNNANVDGSLSIRTDEQPSITVTASSYKGVQRAWLDIGRVVAMTPRALARFQSFPDWYKLPDNARLAAKGIGNAVPPLLYQGVIEPLLGGL